ncbi:MAG: cytochrome b [Alphaproteobacteria bacterium]|jgi:cytochrome b561|nr:cytochrome b [Alphaproteobacteria bacterium]
MAVFNTDARYGAVAKLLHWLIAAGIIGMIGLGLVMETLPPADRYAATQFHKATGLTILALVAIRIIWRLVNRVPDLPPGMPRHERLLAHGTHYGLYVLTVAQPLSGWIMASASSLPIGDVYGLFGIPDLMATSESAESIAGSIHWALGWAIVALLVLHIAGALKHHFIERDNVLRRMLPFARLRAPRTS